MGVRKGNWNKKSAPGHPKSISNGAVRKLELRMDSGCPKISPKSSKRTSGRVQNEPRASPGGHPEHVTAPSAASEPLAGAPYPKTSIFLREIIDFRCRVCPSRPRISTLFVHLGMPSPLSPNFCFFELVYSNFVFFTPPLCPPRRAPHPGAAD